MRKQRRQLHNAGVTLIEMMIVIAIVAIVSAMIMFNYSSFDTSVSVRNLAQDIALSIRKAQTYATSVQTLTTGGSTTSYNAYGVAFSLASPSTNIAVPSQKRFIIFADANRNGRYDQQNLDTCGTVSNGNECVEGFGISSADSIVQICSSAISGACTSNQNQSIYMEFCRPAPDASIYVNGAEVGDCAGGASYAEVVVRSAKNLEQRVRLWNTGQISVQ